MKSGECGPPLPIAVILVFILLFKRNISIISPTNLIETFSLETVTICDLFFYHEISNLPTNINSIIFPGVTIKLQGLNKSAYISIHPSSFLFLKIRSTFVQLFQHSHRLTTLFTLNLFTNLQLPFSVTIFSLLF